MSTNFTKKIVKNYAKALILIAPFYKLVAKFFDKTTQGSQPKRIVLLISRPQDVELLIGLHEKALYRQDLEITFWIVENCVRRYPEVLTQLREKKAVVAQVVSHAGLAKVFRVLMLSDIFLSTVESSTAKNKLPYIITRLANNLDVETYTLQHGFPNIGINYYDQNYSKKIKFAAKTVLTWGPLESLPSWVSQETRKKCKAVGCPKELVFFDADLAKTKEGRPIIAVFESLHGQMFNEEYAIAFLTHLQETAKQRKDFRFILKPHPASLRLRSSELSNLFSRLKDVDVIGRFDGDIPAYTTPWLLANSSGVITTFSTIAFDAAMAGVPVAIARYGLDLAMFSPLSTLDCKEDWLLFLSQIEDGNDLIRKNVEFLSQVNVPGDAANRILDLIS